MKIVEIATVVVLTIIGLKLLGTDPARWAHADRKPAERVTTASLHTARSDQQPMGRTAILRKKADGHFWAGADVDGTRIDFLVDTGASVVAQTRRDAQRIGIDVGGLDYSVLVNTAAGETRGAPVTLDKIKIGRVTGEDVRGLVLEDGLSTSLLGMSFLGALHSYRFQQDNLILRE